MFSLLGRRIVRYNRSVLNFDIFTGIFKGVKSGVTTGKTRIKLLLLAGIVVFWSDRALAVQQHGGAEGLVAHQIGHILFFSGIAYLLYKIFRSSEPSRWLSSACK